MQSSMSLPFLSAAIMLVFAVSVLRRYGRRRSPPSLFWGIGLTMFALATLAEGFLAVAGWNTVMFILWYLCGAALNAAWIGHGTLLLLVRRPWVRWLTAALIIASLATTVLMLQTTPRLTASSFDPALAISEQYRAIMPPIDQGGIVRLTTPFFNIYGVVTLVGGAAWSGWLFFRKRILPHRVVGNGLIAAGALSVAFASTLTRLGYGGYLYLGELLAAGLMYAGFVIASGPATQTAQEPLSHKPLTL